MIAIITKGDLTPSILDYEPRIAEIAEAVILVDSTTLTFEVLTSRGVQEVPVLPIHQLPAFILEHSQGEPNEETAT